MARRKYVWEKLHPDNDRNPVENRGPGRPVDFAGDTQRATGKSKETINRAIRRATEVCQAARDLIRGTALDTCDCSSSRSVLQ